MKKARCPVRRNMGKLKRILMECLLEKNILETRGGAVGSRKPATQFLRFGRG